MLNIFDWIAFISTGIAQHIIFEPFNQKIKMKTVEKSHLRVSTAICLTRTKTP